MSGHLLGNRTPDFVWNIKYHAKYDHSREIVPGDLYPVIRRDPANPHELEAALMRWGLVPHWCTHPADIQKYGSKTHNARSETAHELPTFRDSFQRRRCLIQISGFYEWRKIEKFREKHQILSSTGGPLILAGLWDRAYIEDETLDSFTILTCPPNALMDEVHHRMPVILGQKAARDWMEGRGDPAELLRPCPSHWLDIQPAEE
ncbi:SOS response-associated peptidase [Deinococcus cellulosilyticus]|uniref:Abasic site processing protein n=1 Tax=Deinococcus cellulosilyticus (strain DSM 18568 / NBRC 106333 / KACC 11606 / 5516J-15) TaxID=1223518 RepID=A0A511N4H3_DEIC1|nr:SOS response-associated peptidase [Deinococcus cellulosilyticus]GEM47732.1 hypothetical protein DC3_33670 [Deinococcus cellulosilyticus NBRC 106333 = KACC 11606]